MACRFLSSIESSPFFSFPPPPEREKVGAVFLNAGLHKKPKPQGLSQTARSDGGTIWKARKIFLPARANSPVMHQCIFAEGWPHLFPQSRREWETQKLPPKKKGGSSVLYSGFHGNSNPKGSPKLPGAMVGQFGKRGRFFRGEGRLPRYAPAYFHRGAALFFSPIPQGMGNTKAPTEEKGGSSVYKGRTNR